MKRLAVGFLGCGLAWTGLADIVTNDVMPHVTVPTVLSGVTNIIRTTADVNISADLTLKGRTFLWLHGNGGTGYVNLAPTASDATLTIDGNSGFFTAYRYSCDGNYANSAWAKVGIDEMNKNTPAGYYRVRIGAQGGAPGSTGSGRIVIKTSPSFGYNAVGAFWARYLTVETSAKPDPETGYVDFLDIANGTVADISRIETRPTANPSRILFRGGTLLRNNATSVDAPIAPAAGATLVLWGVDGADIRLKKQFQPADFTRRQGNVRIVGKDLRLVHSGNTPAGVSGENHFPWRLASADHVSWGLTGNICLDENAWLRTDEDNLLPYGAGTGGIVLGCNTGVKEANIRTQVPYTCLDLYGTEQHLNGVTSTYADYRIGVVTNSHATLASTLVLGAGDVPATLNAKCTARVAVVKEGAGALMATDATGESLAVSAGSAAFAGASAFTNLSAAAGATLSGTVGVRTALTTAANVDARALRLALDADATVSATGELRLLSLTRAGVPVAAGVYAAAEADWVASGTVVVMLRDGEAVADIAWTGAGATDSASLAANWSDGHGAFDLPRGRPVFATAGARAVLDSGVSAFRGLRFDAPGDFTVVTNGPGDKVDLYDSLDVALPEGDAARTYTLAAPVSFLAEQSVVLTTNVTVQLLGGSAALAGTGLTLAGPKQGTGSFDYADGGQLVLENARISGPIVHKRGGGWLVLRGDVGNPGDTAALELDYVRYRNGKDTSGGLMFGGLTRLEGATVWKPVTVQGQGQVGGISDRWFICGAGTTNTFKETVSCGPSTAICAERNALVVFEKGVSVTGGGFNPRSMDGTPATFVFNGPLCLDSTSRQINANSASRLVFNSKGNYSRLCYQSSSATVEFGVDDAFDATGFVLDNASARLELGTTHQKATWLISGTINSSTSAWYADNSKSYVRGTVNGDYPSALEITAGAPDEAATSVTNCGVAFTGWVKLEKSGAGYHRMLPLAHTSAGDVEVSGGTLAFDKDATWLDGTNVTVKSTGTLKLGGTTFGPDCVFNLEGGDAAVDLAAGVVQKTAFLVLDGRNAASGSWGSPASDAAHKDARFRGTGVLVVKSRGFCILFR